MKMTRDNLEYAISQYIDGTLPPLERDALEEQLAADAEARATLEEYRRLDATMKHAMPLPEVAWDALTANIQQALANEETPVRHYRLGGMGWTGRLAIAASVLLAVSIGIRIAQNDRTTTTPGETGTAIVSGPVIPEPTVPVVADISVGPSPNLARDWRATEEVVSRPTVVLIDRGASTGQDSEGMY